MGLARYERRILKQKIKNKEGEREPKNLKKANYLIVGAIVLMVSVLGYTFTGYTVGKNSYDNFAKCLSESSRLYVSANCEECEKQKELFGSSSQYIDYAECVEGMCQEIGVYPTWEIRGKLYSGLQSLEKLSELSGCRL